MKNISLTVDSTFLRIENFMHYVANQIMLANTNKPEVISEILHKASDNIDKRKDELYSFTHKDFDFIDAEGCEIVAFQDVVKKPHKFNFDSNGWLKRSKKFPWKGHVGEVQMGATSKRLVIPFGIGITNKDNKFLGVLDVGIDVKRLVQKIEENLGTKEHYRFIMLNEEDYTFVIQSSDNGEFKDKNQKQINNLEYLKKNKPLQGALSDVVCINNVDYLFYNKSISSPFVVLIGIEKKKITDISELQNKIVDLKRAGKYNEMFLASLAYLFQSKIVNPIINRSDSKDNFHIPEVFSSSVNDLFLELEQMEDFLELKMHKELEDDLVEQKQKLMIERERLFRSIAHDLKNPLAGVVSAVEMLESNAGLKEDAYDMINNSVYNMQELLDGMSLIAKLETGTLKLNETEFNLSRLIDDVIKANQFTVKARGLYLRKEVGNNLRIRLKDEKKIVLYADKSLLSCTMFGLLSNAFKFIVKGGVKIVLDIEEGSFVIKVIDSGIGIKKTEIPALLRDFDELELDKKKHNLGGFGFSLLKKCVKIHKGELEIDSDLGKGVAVIMRFDLGMLVL